MQLKSNPIEFTIMLALQHHAGQLDKQGQPYILHVLRVGLAGETPKEKIVGFLHDTIEDTTLTMTDLAQWYDAETLEAVHSVTRQKGESYPAFIRRAGANKIGRKVKINDLLDNLGRADQLTDKVAAAGFRRKYTRALLELTSAAEFQRLGLR